MKCHYCKIGDALPGVTTSVETLKSLTAVIKGVPADVCSNCGEGYYSLDVVKQLGKIADDAKQAGVETLVRWYDADMSLRGHAYSANGTQGGYVDKVRLSDYPVNAERTCFLCRNGELESGGLTDTSITRGTVAVVVKSVPAEVCNNCREPYLELAVYEQLKREFVDAEKSGVEFMVRKYVPAEGSRDKAHAESMYADVLGE